MNVAQKVRLWFILGISILMAILFVGLGVVPDYELATGGGDPFYAWLILAFVANVTLGSICVYRFTHPLAPKQPAVHAGGYPPYSTYPPQYQQPQQYPQGYQPPPAPYQQPPSPSGR